jgi:hypothetical protein
LKSTCNTAVGVSVLNWRSISRKLALAIDRCGNRLAACHSSPVENIFSILVLREVKTGLCAFDINAEKEAECTHVPDCKFSMEFVYDVSKESGAGSSENNIVDIEEEIDNVSTFLQNK